MINLSKVILPGQTIGIIGGGQLGKMMTLSAKAMGYRVIVLDPTPDCPCGQVADEQIVGAYNDLSAIEQLARKCDVITYEFENIDAEALEWLTNNTYVPQGTEILRITQNRIYEKAAIQEAGAPVAPYRVIEKKEDLELAIGELNLNSTLIEHEETEYTKQNNEDKKQRKALWAVLIINFAFFIIEMATGIVSKSMGLVADR